MIEEMEIAKQAGATAFVIYHALKRQPGASVREICLLTGLYPTTVRTSIAKLENWGIVNYTLRMTGKASGYCSYNINEQKVWQLQ